MVSYELVLSTAVLCVIFITGSLNYTKIIEIQQVVWLALPLFPIFVTFFISCLAELNRTPFDLVESESELVAGYMTEYSSVPFVFFFLAEYSSIVLISCLTAIFFCGGYIFPIVFTNNTILSFQALILGLKTLFFCFLIVLIRGVLPRLRYDQLMSFI